MRIVLLMSACLLLAACDTQSPGDEPTRLMAPEAQMNKGTTVRPIEDFLAANSAGTNFCWLERSDRPSNGRLMCVDYTGQFKNQVLSLSGGNVVLPTTYTGHVTERMLKDGTAEVHVTLRGKQALVWANDAGGARLFGYNRGEVAGGATPSLLDFKLTLVYNVSTPGAPLANWADLDLAGTPSKVNLVVNGSGQLRSGFEGATDGDPGQLHMVQNSVQSEGRGNAVADGWPVEFINIQATGN